MGMPDYDGIVDFAKASYRYEPGTKKAVDKGKMSMKELTVYHYINAYANHNKPEHNGTFDDFETKWNQTFPKAIKEAMNVFQISELEARTIFEKVRKIPRG